MDFPKKKFSKLQIFSNVATSHKWLCLFTHLVVLLRNIQVYFDIENFVFNWTIVQFFNWRIHWTGSGPQNGWQKWTSIHWRTVESFRRSRWTSNGSKQRSFTSRSWRILKHSSYVSNNSDDTRIIQMLHLWDVQRNSYFISNTISN